ncbi:LicD family protein [Oribacterium sp. NK2B42]|uniref:LicD family protein n=1 Tax=Oribacterium sp. NK2B42 TaxID=689781 RepID=UPI0004162C0E|nr:LicD family protein [Oribacterium sp. NK2B42]
MVLSNNTDMFYEEINSFIKTQYHRFTEYQELAVKTLNKVHEVCEKHNITYYLAFGSLLGAIRDGGQIPWDYDIDILVPYRYRDELLKVLDTDLSEDFHYDTRYRNRDCRHFTIKVAPKGYDCAFLHVDIFWLIGEEADPRIQEKNYRLRRYFYNCSIYKFSNKRVYSRMVRIKRKIKNFRYLIYPYMLLERKYLKLLEKPFDKYEYCTYNGRNRNIFKSKWFGVPQKITLANGLTFYIPEDYESILKATYGDYMRIPDIDKRIDEFTYSLKNLEKYAKLEA